MNLSVLLNSTAPVHPPRYQPAMIGPLLVCDVVECLVDAEYLQQRLKPLEPWAACEFVETLARQIDLSITPATWSPDDAEHLTYAAYLERFAGQDCCHFDLPWPLKLGTERAALRAGFHNCLSFKPGARFAGSFVITDSAHPMHAVFVFVKD